MTERTNYGPRRNTTLIEAHEYAEKTGEVAAPRIVQKLHVLPIKPSSLPNLQQCIDNRPGSGDMLKVKSHYGRNAE